MVFRVVSPPPQMGNWLPRRRLNLPFLAFLALVRLRRRIKARRLTAPARNEHARYLVIRGLGSPVMYSTPNSHRFMAATRSSFVWYPHDEHL